jgi:CHAT domain-containing protein
MNPSPTFLSDFAVSSYVPSLAGLLLARKTKNTPSTPKWLVVAEPDAQDFSPLPDSLREVEIIRSSMANHPEASAHIRVEIRKSRIEVLEQMNDASVIHLACHGVQDRDQPLSSGFLLREERLTISDLMKLNLPNAQFAFLSACESAASDREQPDEAIHLAAAMIFAGVSSVVGTLWRASRTISNVMWF